MQWSRSQKEVKIDQIIFQLLYALEVSPRDVSTEIGLLGLSLPLQTLHPSHLTDPV